MVHVVGLLLPAVVEHYVETAAHGDHYRPAMTMGMTTPAFTSGHVISPVHPFDFKRDVPELFSYRQVTAWIRNPRKLDDFSKRPLVHQSGMMVDRKSTRLNSSHANISYAVFCLKKKKPSKHYRLILQDCH